MGKYENWIGEQPEVVKFFVGLGFALLFVGALFAFGFSLRHWHLGPAFDTAILTISLALAIPMVIILAVVVFALAGHSLHEWLDDKDRWWNRFIFS